MSSSSKAAAAALPYSIIDDAELHDNAVEALYDRAFGPGRFAKTAERLREGNDCLKHLSRRAVSEGEVIAAVRLWPLMVGDVPGAVFVGPVAVDEAFRGSSLGLELTELCLEAAQKDGWKLAILIGSADYFGRIGFTKIPTQDYPIPGYVPEGRLLARELSAGVLADMQGPISVPRDARPAS